MRIAVVMNREESARHRERQAREPDMLDPDPVQRRVADCVVKALVEEGFSHIDEDNLIDEEGSLVEAVDLYATVTEGTSTREPEIRYLYTLVGEPL